MEIKLQNNPYIKVNEIVKGFYEPKNDDEGVVGYDGKLDIRPPYQRGDVYSEKESELVIDSMLKQYPINVMYWVEKEDGTYEILDGQQRTLSICRFLHGDLSVVYNGNRVHFHNLPDDIQVRLRNYELMVYICKGEHSEKLAWFETINIAGKKLTKQEVRNAIYAGPWVSDARVDFSKERGPAYRVGKDYMSGQIVRQAWLETVIRWVSKGNIEDYMGEHQHDDDAQELWTYFERVIKWTKKVFIEYRREIKGVPLGLLYNEFKNQKVDANEIEKEIKKLMRDEDVGSKKGIFSYVFTKDESDLQIRSFTDQMKREAYERQGGICPITNKKHLIKNMEAHHMIPWKDGGKTNPENCVMLSKEGHKIETKRLIQNLNNANIETEEEDKESLDIISLQREFLASVNEFTGHNFTEIHQIYGRLYRTGDEPDMYPLSKGVLKQLTNSRNVWAHSEHNEMDLEIVRAGVVLMKNIINLINKHYGV